MLPVLEIPPSPLFAPRSSKWEAVELNHIHKYPKCTACGTLVRVEVHHIRPYHLYPELELMSVNLLTLCRPHHLMIGHLMDWAAWNPSVIATAKGYRRVFGLRTYQREEGK